MITLSSADSQIVRYAKGHFGETGRTHRENLIILVAHWVGMHPSHVNDQSIVSVLTTMMEKLNLKMDHRFIAAIIFGVYWKDDKSNPVQNFIEAVLGEIRTMSVMGRNNEVLVQLQPIDESLLATPAVAQG